MNGSGRQRENIFHYGGRGGGMFIYLCYLQHSLPRLLEAGPSLSWKNDLVRVLMNPSPPPVWENISRSFLTDVERGGRVEVHGVRSGDGQSLDVVTVDEQLHRAPLHHEGQPVPGGGEGGDGEDGQRLRPELVEGGEVERDLLHAEAGPGCDAQSEADHGVRGRHHGEQEPAWQDSQSVWLSFSNFTLLIRRFEGGEDGEVLKHFHWEQQRVRSPQVRPRS